MRVHTRRRIVPTRRCPGIAQCSRATVPAPPPCLPRTTAPSHRPSWPSRGRGRPRARSRSAPAPLVRARGSTDSRSRGPRRSCSSALQPRGQIAQRHPRRTRHTGAHQGRRRRSSLADGARAAFWRVLSRMKRSITSTADGPWRESPARPRAAPSRSANWIAITAFAAGRGTSDSVASSTTPSVPSEPTINRVRLKPEESTKASRLYPPTLRRILGNRRATSSPAPAAIRRTSR